MDFLTLSQLNDLIGEEIRNAFPDTCWVMAETSDVRLNKNGHCYLEFVEKEENTDRISAKARGYIWANTFQMLRPYFEMKTGQAFVSGIKVLVKVSVDFHSVYGYGLTVYDIDPTYTLGDLLHRREEILNRLKKEGVFTLNKELELPLLPQRIAVITSPTAAGYEDFLDHLQKNTQGFAFYLQLFPAVMQGEQTEKSIISALDAIFSQQENFDVVVIIRGGGASSDLASFDTYPLAANCAQFPLPVITGIGHERDDTVLDLVAHHRAKTPTAVADFLISRMEEAAGKLFECQSIIILSSQNKINSAQEKIQQLTHFLPVYAQNRLEKQQSAIQHIQTDLVKSADYFLKSEEAKLNEKQSFFKLSSPEYILSKGYSITLKNGKAVKSAKTLAEGDVLETVFFEGKIKSTV
ncbi:exodeoxyribonuclease 7 large subunit [Bacteroidia bacterium]|nr:exodeoxyribonuclease 7 large subunit [Bacteroidia bacterium]